MLLPGECQWVYKQSVEHHKHLDTFSHLYFVLRQQNK
jgi:hypothetical protein